MLIYHVYLEISLIMTLPPVFAVIVMRNPMS